MKDQVDPFSKALEIFETGVPVFSTCARRIGNNIKKPMNAPGSKKKKIEVRDEFALGVAFLGTTLRKNGLKREKDIPYIALYDEMGVPKSFAQWANSLFEVEESSMADNLRQRIHKEHLWRGKPETLQTPRKAPVCILAVSLTCCHRNKEASDRTRRSSSWFEKQPKEGDQEERAEQAGGQGENLAEASGRRESIQMESSVMLASTMAGEEQQQGSSRRLHLDMSRVNSESNVMTERTFDLRRPEKDDLRPSTAREHSSRHIQLSSRPFSARFPPRDHVRENILSARRQRGTEERPLSWRRQQQAIATVQTRRQEIEEGKVRRIKDTIERRDRRLAMIQNDLIKEESERRQKLLLISVVCSSFFNLLYKEFRKRREALKSDFQIVREDTERGLRISTVFLAFIGVQIKKGNLLKVFPACARVHKWLRQILYQCFSCIRSSSSSHKIKKPLHHFPEFGIVDERQAASFFMVASKLDRLVKKRQAEIIQHAGNVIRSFLQEANRGKVVVNMIRLLATKVNRIQRWWRKRLQAHVRRFAALRHAWTSVERAIVTRSLMAEVATRLIAAGERPACLELFPAALQAQLLNMAPSKVDLKGQQRERRRRSRQSLVTEMSTFLQDLHALLELSHVEPSEMSEVSEESEAATHVSTEVEKNVAASRASLRRLSIKPQDVEGIVQQYIRNLQVSPAMQFKVLIEKLQSLQEKFAYLRRRYQHQLDQYRSTIEFQQQCSETQRKLRTGRWLEDKRPKEEEEEEERNVSLMDPPEDAGGETAECFSISAPKFPSFPISTQDSAKISFWIVSTHEKVGAFQAAEGENINPFFQSKDNSMEEEPWEVKSRDFLCRMGDALFPSSDTMMVSSLPKEVPLFSLSKERLVANVDAMLAEIEQAEMSRRTDVFRSSAGLSHLNARARRSSLLGK
ncbi:hypothetical protein GUITHDRAFT_163150 [Guillardia theta CCMP2712]|uniref:Uncharacterized protein n=1 Tax=Guillardia theta (strain CCMP2712) TaxID=905079 RepID=L1JBG0_GUITC|nr:hypothetical protein GUITHDRAFT_163150 [Guillardia theta CCMP2712]EKX45841.1 hypothetical protein GUITHDRAFT_163150 [Guillardia theta CCMP2712]|eukprot:XP_005832821.1 hypothetical protein GUITHDRAFT_163150 [Guillardia theta CCMP2712]